MKARGSHGTTESRYMAITHRGFQLTQGRAGKGVYLWRQSRHYTRLAVCWYKQQRKRGVYDQDSNPAGVVIIAVVNLDEDEYLDLEDPATKDAIAELAERRGINAFDANEIAGLHDLFISRMEQKLGKAFAVISVRVAPPQNCDYSIRLLGAPVTYIVRDPARIKLDSVERIRNE